MKYVVLLSSLFVFLGFFAQTTGVSYLFSVPSDAATSAFFKNHIPFHHANSLIWN